MDEDELLARQLQEMEFRQLSQGPQIASHATFDRALDDVLNKIEQSENQLLQALAMSLMPWDEMQQRAQRTCSLNQADPGATETLGGVMQYQDYLMVELLLWFKGFFAWVDAPKCSACGQPTAPTGTVPPSPAEAMHMASRTETYICRTCGIHTRFPRYNSVEQLLNTRCGRCGEWANAFLLFCRAAGFEARYIWDINDHVWTEFWSEGLGRWVHLDPCEATFDKPLLYEAGWGKAMSYVIGVGTSGAADVTGRYTALWPQVQSRRTKVPEAWLSQRLGAMTHALRAGLPPHMQQQCLARDKSEEQELSRRRGGGVCAGDLEGLGGRTTGSEAWRQERGEAGGEAASMPAVSPSPAPACTPWAALPTGLWGPEQQQQQAAGGGVFELAGRLMGGGCRASGENGRAEGGARAFDGDVDTKWLDFGGGAGGSSWLEFRLEAGQPPVALAAYDLVSANDSEERDPRDWTLEGLVEDASVQGQAQAAPAQLPADNQQQSLAAQQGSKQKWVVLDQQKGVVFDCRHQIRSFWIGGVARGMRCSAWRLCIASVRDPVAANSVQLAGWSLYGEGPSWIGCSAKADPGSVETAALLAQQAPSAVPQLQLSLLVRLLSNIATSPADPKFRCVRASKVTSLWSHAHSRALLLAVGFRPLITRPPAPGTEAPGTGMLRGGGVPGSAPQAPSKDVCLVLEAGPMVVARAAAAAEALQKNL